MAKRYPTMRTVELKMRRMPDVLVDATVSLETGRPVVTVRVGDGDDSEMTPSEARRVAKALIRAAECCDSKERWK